MKGEGRGEDSKGGKGREMGEDQKEPGVGYTPYSPNT